MHRRRFLVVLAGSLALAACGSDKPGGRVTLQVITPVGSPTRDPKASETPIAPPELLTSADAVYQAGAILLSVTGEITSGSVTALGLTIPLSKGSNSLYTFVPVDTMAPSGPATMKVDFVMRNGTKGSTTYDFEVIETGWTQDSLEFTPEQVAKLLDPVVQQNELDFLHNLYSKITPEKLWDGPWQVPVDSAVTGRYGEQRSVNGGPFEGHHSGTDFGASMDTEVHAGNNGIVVLARPMTVRGNYVVVNHGGGLYTGYAHMNELRVKEGDLVATGDVVGLSGTTGLSTAPHLHWEMAQSGVLLDALRFCDGTNGI